MLSLFTALKITLASYLPTWEIICLVLVVGIVGAVALCNFGNWDYTHRRTLYKKDVEIETLNNEYTQSQIKFHVAMGKKMGIDVSEIEKWVRG